jgi:hypothetical protein
MWNRSMLDPFQPGANFGNFSGSVSSGMCSDSAASSGNFGPGKPESGGFLRFGSEGMHGLRNSFASPCEAGGAVMRSRTSGTNGPYGAGLVDQPSLNQLMRGGPKAPRNSSLGAFRPFNQSGFDPGGNATGLDFSRMLATGMFTSPDLGNGVHFSAGTGNGGRGVAGAMGEPKHSSPTVALKLSF